MDSERSKILRSACRQLLQPIASVIMKCGMTWKEFAEISKSVFVDVATAEFGIRGRPTNISRVSILTGISRKEVKRQRELLQSKTADVSTKTTDATRVLAGWHQDTDYTDRSGRPLPLQEDGPKPSFASLFATYGGDTPQQTLIRELRNADSVTLDVDGRLIALRRYHMPVSMTEGNIRFFGSNLFDHASTLNNNVTGKVEDRRFEGFAVDDRIEPSAAEDFNDYLERRAQQFLEEVDDWLAQHRASDSESETIPIRLGVGVYAIKGKLPEGNFT